MFVAINFKICDNSPDCSGIEVCQTEAFQWDKKNRTISIIPELCTTCFDCEEECPVGAIRVARDEAEFEKIKQEIAEDPREIADLLVDRYGAQPIKAEFNVSEDKFDIQILKSPKLCVVEFFQWELVECLISSIPIKNLFQGADIKYRKLCIESDEFKTRYSVNELPALLFFKDGDLIGKIEGFYGIEDEEELKVKIESIL